MEILHDLCTVSLICYRINFFLLLFLNFFLSFFILIILKEYCVITTSTNPVLFKLALSSVALDFFFFRGFVLIERKRALLLFYTRVTIYRRPCRKVFLAI